MKNAVFAGPRVVFTSMYLNGVPYRDLGPEHFDHLAADRLTHHYVHRLEQLGHRVTLQSGTDVA